MKKLNNSLFISVQKNYLTTINGPDDSSVFKNKYFADEISKKKFDKKGLVAMANLGPD